ncbi:MAG: hypothetical protein Q7V57_03675 [Actinomycetota bacterium]|nr:hypothetical protein [Actinomycetota bacterium]
MAGRGAVRRLTAVGVAALMLVGAWVGTRTTSAAQGDPVSSFGDNGLVRLGTGTDRAFLGIIQILLLPDGRVMAEAGSSFHGVVLTRLTAGGMPDPTWNQGAPVPVPESGTIIQNPDGSVSLISMHAVRRFTKSGASDQAFGSAGVAAVALPGTQLVDVKQVAGGAWLVLTRQDFGQGFVTRVLPSGMIDGAFGTSGTVSAGFYPTRMVSLASGVFYVATHSSAALYGFTSSGVALASFGTHGVLQGPFQDPCLTTDSVGHLVLIDPTTAGVQGQLYLKRLVPTTGAIDATFGAGGYASVTIPSNVELSGCGSASVGDVTYVILHRSQTYGGQIFVVAVDVNAVALAGSFGSGGADGDGSITVPVTNPALAWRGLVSATSAGIVLGFGQDSPRQVFRYDVAGSPVTAFAGDGEMDLIQHPGAVVFSTVRESDGATLVGYRSGTTVRIARVGADGGPVAPATSHVIVTRELGMTESYLIPAHLLALPDGRFAMTYQVSTYLVGPWAMAMYHHDGTPDLTFGTNGVASVASVEVRAGGAAGAPVLIMAVSDGISLSFSKISAVTGALDSSFGTAGSVAMVAPTLGHRYGFAVDTSGRTVFARGANFGEPSVESQAFAIVSRLTANGQPDQSFGSSGRRTVTTQLRHESWGNFLDVTLVGSNIVLTGQTVPTILYPAPDAQVTSAETAARLTESGALDTSFGTGGVVEVAAAYGPWNWSAAAAVDADGITFLRHHGEAAYSVLRLSGGSGEVVGRVDLAIPHVDKMYSFIVPAGADFYLASGVQSEPVVGEVAGDDATLMKVSLSLPWVFARVGSAAQATQPAVRLRT